MFRLEDAWGNYLNSDENFGLKVVYSKVDYNETTDEFESIIDEYYAEKCSNQSITDPILINSRNLSEWHCFNFTEDGIGYGGSWSGNFVYQWNIVVNNCNRYGKCMSQSELEDTLKDEVYFSMYYPQYYFSPGNYNEPLSLKYTNLFLLLNADINLKNLLYIKSYQIEDDRGWIFEDTIIRSVIAYDSIDKGIGIKYKERESQEIYFQSIYYNSDKLLFHRNYMKIQEVAAMIGGFMKIILFIAQLLVTPYSNFLLNQKLSSLIVDKSNPCNMNISLKPHTDVPNLINSFSQKKDQSYTKVYNFNNNVPVYKKRNDYDNNKIVKPYSFRNYVYSKLLRKTNEALKEYELSLKFVNSKLDFAYFLSSFNINHAFQSIFLNNLQLNALTMAKGQSISSLDEITKEDNIKESVINYFQKKHIERSIDDIDKRCYHLLDDNLKELIGDFNPNPQNP